MCICVCYIYHADTIVNVIVSISEKMFKAKTILKYSRNILKHILKIKNSKNFLKNKEYLIQSICAATIMRCN